MPGHGGLIVQRYAKMWPREVFYIKKGMFYHPDVKQLLSVPGVYMLYRDDQPYYVGRATKSLFHRLLSHANDPKDEYFNFWNFFSAFTVSKRKHVNEVEGILIAAMPTDNSAVPRIEKIHIPTDIANLLRRQKVIESASVAKGKKGIPNWTPCGTGSAMPSSWL
jgi:hypothetical protein